MPRLNRHKLSSLLLLIFFSALVACGPSQTESATESNDQTSEDVQNFLENNDPLNLQLPALDEEEDTEPTSTSSEANDNTNGNAEAAESEPLGVNEESQIIDASGIPMGFTEDGRPYRGNPEAPVVIEEFSDYQCPYCTRFTQQTLPSLLENQVAAGEVVVIFYDFPLYRIHPQAEAAANAARCAGEFGIESYWEYHDVLFNRAQEWSGANPNGMFISLAAEIGITNDEFAQCVNEGRHIEAVTADYNVGISRGVSSTPSFFLNDQPLIGAQPVAAFDQAISALLNGETIASARPEPEIEEFVMPEPANIPIEPEDVAFAIGNPNAPLQIVEYTDYQCPYCQRHSAETMPQILSELVEHGRVYYVLKDFPLDQLHPQARAAAKAARCGGTQEAYLEMHDAVFNSQDRWGGQSDEQVAAIFTELAVEIGLDEAEFSTCYQSTEQDDYIQANLEEGIEFGVNSTPSFFFNGYLASGALPFDNFAQITGWAENGELEAVIEESMRAAYERQVAQQQQQQQPQPAPTPAGPVDVPLGTSYAIGDPNAPVTIVEYTDYQCPFCNRHFQQTFPALKEKYIDTGMVYYVFKDFPLTSIHPQAVLASEAARCAGDQDAYLEMHDALFLQQGEWNGRGDAAALFSGYAADLGLDTTRFDECMSSHQYEAAVQADLQEGIGFGITGTPTFFLNGQRLVGAQPLDTFEQAILQLTNTVNE